MKRLTIACILALTLGVTACNDATTTKETPSSTPTANSSVKTQPSPTPATVPARGSQSVPCEARSARTPTTVQVRIPLTTAGES